MSSAPCQRSAPVAISCSEGAVALVGRAACARGPAPSARSARPGVDGAEGFERGEPRGRDHALEARCPARNGWPARKSRAVIAPPPSACTRVRCTVRPSPHATRDRRRLADAPSTVPGACAEVARATQPTAMQDAAVRPSRTWTACGHGCRPRIWLWIAAPAGVQSIDAVSLVELVRVGRQRIVLRRLAAGPRGHAIDDVDQQLARRAPPARASTSSLVSSAPIGRVTCASIGAGVERLDDAHDRDAGLALAGDHRAMHRRRAAIRGSSDACTLIMPSRGVPSSASRQDLAVGGDDAEVGVERAKRRRGSRRPSAARGCSTGMPRATAHAPSTGASADLAGRGRAADPAA